MDNCELTTVERHDIRQPCAACGTRVFTYATELTAGASTGRHFCTMCADRELGKTLCRWCQRPIAREGCPDSKERRKDRFGGWVHDPPVRCNHAAMPEGEYW